MKHSFLLILPNRDTALKKKKTYRDYWWWRYLLGEDLPSGTLKKGIIYLKKKKNNKTNSLSQRLHVLPCYSCRYFEHDLFSSSTIRLLSAESCSEVIILCFTSICYHRNDCNNLNLAQCLSCRIKQEDWMGCMWKDLSENQNMLSKSKCCDKFTWQNN